MNRNMISGSVLNTDNMRGSAFMVLALILGAIIFAERPDTLTLIGSAIIVGSGIYTLLRNRVVSKDSNGKV